MRALTILQPWASLIAVGAKQIETRSWATKYRGPLAIHAGKGTQNINLCKQHIFWSNLWPYEIAAQYSLQERIDKFLPLGAVIAIADLVNCIKMDYELICFWRETYGPDELAFGDFTPGRYAWILANVRRIEPVAAKGMQGLWNWDNG